MNTRHTRLGFIFFLIYTSVYAAFVLLSAFDPVWMSQNAYQGVNRAVVSGMALIAGAFVLAVLYCWMCRETAPAGDVS